MKNLKIFAIAFLCLFSVQSFAQTFGVKAGLNMANQSAKDDNDSYDSDNKMLLGFNAGVTAEFSVNDAFSVETGLILDSKGFKVEYTDMNGDKQTGKASLMYLDIPINAKYAFDLSGTKLYLAAGPYIGFGLTGKFKGDSDVDVKWGSSTGDANSDGDDYKRLDFGLNFGAGVEFGAIGVGVQYGLGLSNISPYSDGGYKEKNKLFSISLAYKFGK